MITFGPKRRRLASPMSHMLDARAVGPILIYKRVIAIDHFPEADDSRVYWGKIGRVVRHVYGEANNPKLSDRSWQKQARTSRWA